MSLFDNVCNPGVNNPILLCDLPFWEYAVAHS